MTNAETKLFRSTNPTTADVVAACLAVDSLPREERYNRVGAIARHVNMHSRNNKLGVAVAGFQSFGADAAAFKRLNG